MTILIEKEYFYASAKEHIRQIITENNINSVPNKRNGHSKKPLKSQFSDFQVDIPRDRNGEFKPRLIPKYQRDVSGIEEQVISLYGRGMSTRDIHDQLKYLYGIEMSAEMVSHITDRILPEIKEWQARPLNPIYPFVLWTASIIKFGKKAEY